MTSSQHRAGVEPASHLRDLCCKASMCDIYSAQSVRFYHVILMAITAPRSQHPPNFAHLSQIIVLCDKGLRDVSYHCS